MDVEGRGRNDKILMTYRITYGIQVRSDFFQLSQVGLIFFETKMMMKLNLYVLS